MPQRAEMEVMVDLVLAVAVAGPERQADAAGMAGMASLSSHAGNVKTGVFNAGVA